jgi:glucose repression regulatory protein TUP1
MGARYPKSCTPKQRPSEWSLYQDLRGPQGKSPPQLLAFPDKNQDFVFSTTFTPDGNWVLSGSKDRGVQFWDLQTGNVQLRLEGHKHSVISVAASAGGGYFATGSGDMWAKIWSYKPYS